MRTLRYSVASSLDGFIAGPNGGLKLRMHRLYAQTGILFLQYDVTPNRALR